RVRLRGLPEWKQKHVAFQPAVVLHGDAEHDGLDGAIRQADSEALLPERLRFVGRNLPVLDRDLVDEVLHGRAFKADNPGELRIFKAFGELVFRPLLGPEAVAAFEPESLTIRAEIGECELGFGPRRTGKRRDAR